MVLLGVGALVACLSYWVGLSGPFVLDDEPNLGVVQAWLHGNAALSEVLLGNGTWLEHRAVAMASFAMDGYFWGYEPFPFKAMNLAIHILNAAVAYLLVARILEHDPQLAPRARLVAAVVSAAWVLHPLHASTVLYVVQRMAQLATLFSLLALLLYVVSREQIEKGRRRWVLIALVGIPCLTILGIQSKQNAAAVPALCLVIEGFWLRCCLPKSRNFTRLFYGALLAAPALAAIALFAVRPDTVLGGYVEYDFNVGERLLTQARVLCDYLRQILIPHTPSMGVFTDGYRISSGLFSPPSTFFSLFTLLLLTGSAWHVRRRMPAVAAGWFFFLVAHSVESSFLPLEMYYEHRNYLPALGLLIAAAAIVDWVGSQLRESGVRTGRIALAGVAGTLLALALMTHGRARVWSDPVTLVQTERKHHPQSVRAAANYAAALRSMGDFDGARRSLIDSLAVAESDRLRGQLRLLLQSVDCAQRGTASPSEVAKAIDQIPPRLELNTFLVLEVLTNDVRSQGCGELDLSLMARFLSVVASRATGQPDHFNQKWALRNRAAMLFAESGHWDDALAEARLGWQPSTPGAGAASLVEIMLVAGDVDGAERVFDEAWARAAHQEFHRTDLERIRPLIEIEKRRPGWNRRRVAGTAAQPG